MNLTYFIYPRSFDYFHSIVAKLCTSDSTTEYQSCQELETLSVGHFFPKKRQSHADSMVNFGKFFTKKDYNF